jgi:hypothetical protein
MNLTMIDILWALHGRGAVNMSCIARSTAHVHVSSAELNKISP